MTTDVERRLHAEILAIRRVFSTLDKLLDVETQQRIVRYALDRYGSDTRVETKDET